jgi:hypothetical protein
MRKGKAILAAAVTGLGLASGAIANPIVDMSFVVRTMDTTNANAGTIIAPTSTVGTVPHYSMTPGQLFRVEVVNTVRAGTQYQTEADHDGAQIDLGIQALVTHLVSNGGSSGVQAVAATGANAGKWGRDASSATVATRLAPFATFLPTSFTAADQSADGDIDVQGMGYSNNAVPSWDGTQTQSSLQLGLTGNTNVIRGGWSAGTNGGTITTNITDLNVYWDDPADADANALKSKPLGDPQGATFTNATIAIDVAAVPEPASAGLLGVAALGLLARRRRA